MMNRQFLSLVTAALIVMAAFVSCKKDNSGGGDGNSFVIEATNVIGGNSDIDTVKAAISEDYALASDKYQNNGFKLTLPATVPEKYLINITDGFDDFKGTISNPNAKTSGTVISAYNNNGKNIGVFYMRNKKIDITDKNYITANYIYTDRNVTIEGYIEYILVIYDDYSITVKMEYDYFLKKGWNLVYVIVDQVDEKKFYGLSTTKKPSGADLKWYFSDISFLNDYEKQKTYDWQNPFFKIR
jgi:hypothetical protein